LSTLSPPLFYLSLSANGFLIALMAEDSKGFSSILMVA
jgi:hypothetical protein